MQVYEKCNVNHKIICVFIISCDKACTQNIIYLQKEREQNLCIIWSHYDIPYDENHAGRWLWEMKQFN